MSDVMDGVDSDAVRFDIVWTPAWGLPSSEGAAYDLYPENPDPRSRVWWDADAQLGHGMADYLSGNPPLYDLFLTYPAGREWDPDGNDTPGESVLTYRNGMSASRAAQYISEIEDLLPACTEVIEVDDDGNPIPPE